MNIVLAAKNFVRNNPSEWNSIIAEFLHEIWTSDILQSLEERCPDDLSLMKSELFVELQSLDTIHRVRGAHKHAIAEEYLFDIVRNIFKQYHFDLYHGDQEFDIVDLLHAGSTEDFDEDFFLYDEDNPPDGHCKYNSDSVHYGELVDPNKELSEISLNRLLNTAIKTLDSPKQTKKTPSILQFDLFDAKTYALLINQPELMRSMNWRSFERLLAHILEDLGYIVELQQGTKDGGVDLFAIRHTDILGPQKFLLQAKRYKNKVGVEPVRQLAFLHNHLRVTKSCLATTSQFTQGAWQLAKQYRWQLELRDFDGIKEWLQRAAKLK